MSAQMVVAVGVFAAALSALAETMVGQVQMGEAAQVLEAPTADGLCTPISDLPERRVV